MDVGPPHLPIQPESGISSFSVPFFGHCFGLIPASGGFAASAFTVPPDARRVPPIKQPLALEAEDTRSCVPQENGAEKGESSMSYLNSVTIVGFVGADPEQRQARNNGSKFTVLSVATQRSWKNAEDEWSSKTEWHRICVFRPRLAEYVATAIKKGSHVLIEGSLISSTYERPNGKGKKATATKITTWSVRADVVRKLDRGEADPQVATSKSRVSDADSEATEAAAF